MAAVWAWIQANAVWILAALVALDNGLAAIPSVESNSTFQLVSKLLKKLADLFKQPPAPAV